MNPADLLKPSDTFVHRHLGPRDDDIKQMLATLGCDSLGTLVDQTIPAAIRLKELLKLGQPRGEHEILDELRAIIGKNQVFRSLIGMGYYDCIVPAIIQRNILENPGWYTQYTPYQAEISQGRLEALLNFQTMVADLTGLPLANASLLDEGTAAAEAMTMCRRILKGKKNGFFVANDCHPQTIAVVEQRAKPLDIDLHVGSPDEIDFEQQDLFGILLQYPNTHGEIHDYGELVKEAHDAGALVVVATDLLALALLKPPGELGADIAVGNSQRFGVPLGFGGPHAAFMATHDKHLRQMPGRIIGVSKDAHGNTCYRMAVQTREQHIRREKATSNICTAQVLLAIMAGMYGVYHGAHGVRRIAERVHAMTVILAEGLKRLGFDIGDRPFFDTLCVSIGSDVRKEIIARAREQRVNLRTDGDASIGVSLDELTTPDEVATLWQVFAGKPVSFSAEEIANAVDLSYAATFARTSEYMTHPVFNSYHAEHEMLRYLTRLQSRDLSLTSSMIPLGSCTMKLNGTTEMLPITWPKFANIHPFAPAEQTEGYREFFASLEGMLAEITGFPAVSLQPNSGASGEHTGLYVIRAYHESRGEGHRDVSLIPVSAHGTNPASSVMAGCRVVVVACDDGGNIDVADLKAKAEEHRDNLAALMITYPSTHGVFEEAVKEICDIVHANGGQVYLDGANMNAQVGLCTPADIGADVVHLNLHKTFAIPHGGGGPGMGPIACADHLAPFLPGHPVVDVAQPPSAVEIQPTPQAKLATPMYRRNLPHIQAEGRPVFVTFRTYQGWVLPEQVRGRVLEHCLHDDGVKMQLHVAVVIPDHVHLVFTPLEDADGNPYGLAEIMSGIKGASAHSVNKLLERKGQVWQDESFDHILRHNESLEEKVEYICQNPVRKGIVKDVDEYAWLWREWLEETQPRAAVAQGTQPGAAVPQAIGPVSAAPWGSPSVLPISWVYIALLGEPGLRKASQVAILNANYMAKRLSEHYPVLYTGKHGRVAHEFIIDLRAFDKSAHITPDDVCKRLMDFGFHAPTMSFPVAGTLMIEPTESESKEELDRLCDALIAIRAEIRAIEDGRIDRENNPLKNAPHTAAAVAADNWDHPYSREQAAYPAPWLKSHKFWPPVGRIDNVWGDRNLFCTCPSVESFSE